MSACNNRRLSFASVSTLTIIIYIQIKEKTALLIILLQEGERKKKAVGKYSLETVSEVLMYCIGNGVRLFI
jgi:hypothetical protein